MRYLSRMRDAAAVLLFWSLCLWFTCLPAAAANGTVGVSTDLQLQQALASPRVRHIILLNDVRFAPESWPRNSTSESVQLLQRNVTISSQPRFNVLDFAYQGSNWVKLGHSVMLNFSDLVLQHGRYGVGMQLDFVAPSAGATVALWNVVMERTLCVVNSDEPEAVALVPRLPGFPGQQRAHYLPTQCVRDSCAKNVLVYDSFAKISALTADSAAGGYSMVLHNTSKYCLGYASQCADSSIAEACIQRALDALPGAAITPGRRAALLAPVQQKQQDSKQHKDRIIGAAVGAAVGGCLLLALLLGLLRLRLQRWCGHAPLPLPERKAADGGSKHALGLARADTFSSTPPGVLEVKDVEVGLAPDAGSHTTASASSQYSKRLSTPSEGATAAAAANDAACLQDNWELAAWKTSSHSIRQLQAQQQQQQQSRLTSSPFSNPVVSSQELILQGTGATTAQAMLAFNKVSLGVCIGAGSFGRVYKGRWRGMDVAVKVMQHSQAAAASVANEIDLMMGFQHPHLVSAYHFVTWRRRREYARQADDEQLAVTTPWQGSSSGGSRSLGAAVVNSGQSGGKDSGVDTQTWIVQEFCDGGNLSDYCTSHVNRQRSSLPAGHDLLRLLFRLREVADGMQYLHDTARVVHGDLKASNILLCASATAPYGHTAKVADFGLARMYAADETHKSTATLGTVSHMAPELLRFGKASTAADVYSFGIMMWELFTGQVAFQGWQWGAILEHVALAGERLPIPDDSPEDFMLLVRSCWHPDAAQRPTFEQVVKCLDIMIASRQLELLEAGAGQCTGAHTLPAPAMATVGPLRSYDSHPSAISTGAAAADAAVTSSNSSNGEFEMLRVGSMRRVSGVSTATSGSSTTTGLAVLLGSAGATARLGSKMARRPSLPSAPSSASLLVSDAQLRQPFAPSPQQQVLSDTQLQLHQHQHRRRSHLVTFAVAPPVHIPQQLPGSPQQHQLQGGAGIDEEYGPQDL